ncbi:MAG: hypothetical protein ACP5M1_07160, partial [Acidiphilium sp.]
MIKTGVALGKIEAIRRGGWVRPGAAWCVAWFMAAADAWRGVVGCWERKAEQVAERAQDAREAGIMIEQAGKFGFADQAVQPIGGGGDAGAGDEFRQPAMAAREQDWAGEAVRDEDFCGLARRDSGIGGGVSARWGVWFGGLRRRRTGGGAGGEAPADAVDAVPDHDEQAAKQADFVAIAGDGAQKLVHDPAEAD